MYQLIDYSALFSSLGSVGSSLLSSCSSTTLSEVGVSSSTPEASTKSFLTDSTALTTFLALTNKAMVK